MTLQTQAAQIMDASVEEPVGHFVHHADRRVVYGPGAASGLGEHVAELGGTRVLVVTTRSLSAGSGVLPSVLRSLGSIPVTVFAGARQHGPLDTVRGAADAAREFGADVFVSVGGGSAVDIAKGAVMLLTGRSLSSFRRRATKPGERPVDAYYTSDVLAAPPIIAIPTTLSGAEFTGQAGLTDQDRSEKDQYYFRGSAPKIVILDRQMTSDTPRHLWVSSGVKCLDHAIERLYSIHGQPFSGALSTRAAQTIFTQLGSSNDEPDHRARTDLLIASWMAMYSTGNVNVGLGHAMGHQLCSLTGIGHGEAAAVLLPHTLRFNAPEAGWVLGRLAYECGLVQGEPQNDKAINTLLHAIEQLVTRLGIPNRLRDLEVDKQVLPEVARRTIDDTAITGNPRQLQDSEEILTLLEAAW